jgi:hypothetical protein
LRRSKHSCKNEVVVPMKKKKVKVQKCRDSEIKNANKIAYLCPVAVS